MGLYQGRGTLAPKHQGMLDEVKAIDPKEAVVTGMYGEKLPRGGPAGLVAQHSKVHEVAVHNNGPVVAATATCLDYRLAEMSDDHTDVRVPAHFSRWQITALMHYQQIHIAAARAEIAPRQGAYQGDAPQSAGPNGRISRLERLAGALEELQ